MGLRCSYFRATDAFMDSCRTAVLGLGLGFAGATSWGCIWGGGGGAIGEAKLCLLGINIPKILEYCSPKDLEQGVVKTISPSKQYHPQNDITHLK